MILVTGGTGLLGSHLLYALLSDGKEVRAIKRSSSNLTDTKKVFLSYDGNSGALFDKIEWVDADILIPEELTAAVEGVEKVYHCAAYVSFDPRMRSDLIRNNTEGTANIVNACIENNVKKLCHVSSTSALGEAPAGELVSEDIIWTPDKMNSAYSISKFKSEMEVWRGIEEGLDAVIVNPGIIFGAGFWDKGSSSMFTNIKKGLRFYLKGVTAFIGVEDVVFCMMKLMESDIKSQRFILVSENLSYQEVFTMIAKALNVRAPYIEPAPFLSALAWRFDSLRSRFGAQRVITRETVNAGRKISKFSNEKIKEFCGVEFTSVERVIAKVAGEFKKDCV